MPTETTTEPLTKVQIICAWVKRNKSKLVAAFAAIVGVIPSADTTTEPRTKMQKFRAWVGRNERKLVAGFSIVLGYVAGDFGLIDGIKTYIFGA